jgi:hypothetical protein
MVVINQLAVQSTNPRAFHILVGYQLFEVGGMQKWHGFVTVGVTAEHQLQQRHGVQAQQ